MSKKDEILKMIAEHKISVKEGLDQIAKLEVTKSNSQNYFTAAWTPKQQENTGDSFKERTILVLGDNEKELFATLQEKNAVVFMEDYKAQEDYSNSLTSVIKDRQPDTVLFCLDAKEKNVQDGIKKVVLSILNVYKSLVSAHLESVELFYLYEVKEEFSPVNEAAGAFLRSLSMEKSDYCFHVIQVADKRDYLGAIKKETGNQNDLQVKYDGLRKRFVKQIVAAKQANKKIPFEDNGIYVFSGGAGKIGRILIENLVKQYHAHFILLGRSKETEELKAWRERVSKNGSMVSYYACDITQKEVLNKIASMIEEKFGAVNGMIHLAAVLHDGLAISKTNEEAMDVIETKALGGEYLYEAFSSENLKFAVFCSSLSALTGNIGQCDYSYANAYLEVLAQQINQMKGTGFATAVGFPLWDNGGMKPVNSNLKGITDEEGVDFFLNSFGFREKAVYYILPEMQETLKNGQKTQSKVKEIESTYDESKLYELTQQYLIKVISKEMKMPENKLRNDEDLNEIGLDSIMVMEITTAMEADLGTISKTLFFEYTQINTLAEAVIKSKRKQLEGMFGDKLISKVKKESNKKEVVKKEEVPEIKQVPPKNQVEEKALGKAVEQASQQGKCQDIAIIGMAGRYPMSNDMEELWNNLVVGKDCIVEIPKQRWDYNKYFHADKNVRGKTYSKWGGFIDNYDKFDSLFFNISPREADYLDPQERVFLETAWETVEDAGYTREELNQNTVGVFVGVMYGHYQLYNVEEGLRGELPVQSSSYASIANRVSYALNLHGASMAIDTMCSSSLTAIHLACQSIREGESDMAIAGGVNISSHPLKYIMLSQQKFLSTDGRCRSFGEGGDGYVPGEGSGAVLLKSLEQAEKDGDRIYAIIKGSGVNHGGKTRGYSVPNPIAQTSVIRSTMDKYGINPQTISYVETHGTGTALGDPIEISGLSHAFGESEHGEKTCAIGSIKSNIGHAESASGVASVSKVILQMQHKQLVPSIHSDVLNPNIDFSSVPFYVQRNLEEWKPAEIENEFHQKQFLRRAGINSFGAGGSNAFVILEEYEDHRDYSSGPDKVLITLSAKTVDRLKAYAEKLKKFISKKHTKNHYSVTALKDVLKPELKNVIADTMQIPLEQIEDDTAFDSIGIDYVYFNQVLNRLYDLFMISNRQPRVESNNIIELANMLVNNYEEDIHEYFSSCFDAVEKKELPKLYEMAYMLQIGREQYEQRLAIIASTYEELEEKLTTYLLESNGNGIYKTEQSVFNETMSAVLKGTEGDRFIKSLFDNQELEKLALIWCSGHTVNWKQCYENIPIRKCSLPTYPFKRELHWIQKPNKEDRVNQNVYPLIDDYVLDAQGKGITFKKYIKSSDFIVSDHLVNQQKVLPGVAYIEMIFEALEKLGKKKDYDIDSIYWLHPVYANTDVEIFVNIIASTKEMSFEIYSLKEDEHVVHCSGRLVPKDNAAVSLEWNDIQGEYQELNGDNLYEMFAESGITYQNTYRGIQSVKVTEDRALAVVSVPVDTDDYYAFPGVADSSLQSIAVLSRASGKTNVPYFIGKVSSYRRLQNTGKVYVTKQNNGNINAIVANDQGEICLTFQNIVLRELVAKEDNFLYYPVWREATVQKQNKIETAKAVVVYPEVFAKLADKLEKKMKKTTIIRVPITEKQDGLKKWEDTIAKNEDLDEIFFLNGLNQEIKQVDDEEEFALSQKRSITFLFRAVKALMESAYGNQKLRINVVTNNTVIVKDYKNVNPYASVMHGFTLSLDKEMPNWTIKCMDIDLFYDNMERASLQIISERGENTSDLVVYRENQRYIRLVYPIGLPDVKESAFVEQGVYMIFGGAGGIGGVLASYLSEHKHANIVLIGRRGIDSSIEGKLSQIKQKGGNAIYIQGDLGKLEDIKQAIETTKKTYGKINGVIHSALVLNDKSVRFMSEDVLNSSLESKVTGSMLLNKALEKEEIDFMLYFSSANSLLSAAGQSNYSAACTFEDAYAEYQNEKNEYAVKRINWGYWGTVGVVSSEKYNKSLAQKGTQSIEPAEGMQVIEKIVKYNVDALVPYKADKQLLNMLGIQMNQVIEVNETAQISKLRITEDALSAEEKQQIQKRTDTFVEFEGVGGVLLLDKFQTMGYFKHAGERISMNEMKEQIGVVSRYDRMFAALIHMLERYQYVKIEKDMVTALPLIDERETATTIAHLQEHVDELTEKYPEIKPYINLIKVCVNAYKEVLSDKVSHMSVMFPNGSKELVEHIYTGNVITDLFNRKMAELVKGYVSDVLEKNPQATIRILEVGAGTGGTSGFIMKEVNPYSEHVVYTYTDISKSFIEFGRRKFGKDYPFVEFEVLNVEEDTLKLRDTFGLYDIVVATNVLHATKTIDNTLTQIKNLMKKDGWVIINEITAIQDYATLTFGLTDGWWAYEDEDNRLPLSPLLNANKWKSVLRKNGFTNFSTYGIKGVEDYHSEQSLLIAKNDGITFTDAKEERSEVVIKPILQNVSTERPSIKKTELKKREAVKDGASLEHIQEQLKEIFSLALNMDKNEIDIHTNVSDYGVDSLVSMEVNRELEKYYKEVPSTFIFDYPTIAEMASSLKSDTETKDLQTIKDTITQVIAKVLNTEIETLDEKVPLENYGVDSLITMEIVNHVSEYYPRVNAQMFIDDATILSIAQQIEKDDILKNFDSSDPKNNTLIKLVDQYNSVQEERFYTFWSRLDKSKNLNEYVKSLRRVDSPASLDKGKINQVIVSDGDNFGIEVILTGSGKPLVFIPGYGVTGVQWMKQVEYYKDKNQVIILHMPGVGLSTMNKNISMSLENIANMFMKAIQRLGVNEKIQLVASSFGTMIAQQIAYQYKDNIESMIAISGFTSINEKFKKTSVSQAIQNDIKDLDVTEQKMINLSNYINPTFTKFAEYLQTGEEYSTENILSDIDVETLVIVGSNDTVIEQAMFESLANGMRNGRIYKVKNAGHMPNWTHSDEVNRIMDEFFRN